MTKKQILSVLAWALTLFILVGCGANVEASQSSDQQVQAALSEDHTNPEDFVWDSTDVTNIILSGTSITVEGDGAIADGSRVTIQLAGNYSFSGSLADGQIVVDTQDEDLVRLILNGVNISNSTSAPIYIANAEETIIVLADNTDNVVSDGAAYVFAEGEDEPNAAIFSKSNLTIYGTGTLTVIGNYNDAIGSKDGLVITSGTLIVTAVDDGIRGKDYLVVQDGSITVNAGGDGLKSDNEEDASMGYISIATGMINITAAGDAIQAETSVLISDGQFVLVTGGGSTSYISEDTSAKGIKGALNVQIDSGTFTIDSADDAVHSNGSIVVNGGTLTLLSGDDGIHADATLTINGGDTQITESYEGIESAVITLNGGNIHLNASDDGVNVAGGNDGSGMTMNPGRGGRPDQAAFSTSTDYYLYINGGYLVVNAAGDGLDANGAIEMTGGVVIVNGPTEQMNGALDYDAWFNMTGGWFVAVGSSGMPQAPGESSAQASLLLNLSAAQPAGTLIRIESSDGSALLTFAPSKTYQLIAFSSPELATGATYNVYLGGSSDGTLSDGLYEGGTYTPGSQYTSFTVSSIVTTVGTVGGFGRPPR